MLSRVSAERRDPHCSVTLDIRRRPDVEPRAIVCLGTALASFRQPVC